MSVKKKVKDMNETLSSLVAEIQSLRDTVDSQFTELCQLNRNTERLLKENRELRIRLEKYERPSKDSNNSGTPPAKESIPAQVTRRTKSQRQKSDRPVGGQVGHEGTTRKVVNIPDEIEEVSAHYASTISSVVYLRGRMQIQAKPMNRKRFWSCLLSNGGRNCSKRVTA